MIRVSNHLLSIVFRFHYHSQKVIGSLGKTTIWENIVYFFPSILSKSKNITCWYSKDLPRPQSCMGVKETQVNTTIHPIIRIGYLGTS